MYIRSNDHPNLFKNSNSLNVQTRENSMENRRTYQIVKIQWKIVCIRCTDCQEWLRTLILLKVQNRENSMENCIH